MQLFDTFVGCQKATQRDPDVEYCIGRCTSGQLQTATEEFGNNPLILKEAFRDYFDQTTKLKDLFMRFLSVLHHICAESGASFILHQGSRKEQKNLMNYDSGFFYLKLLRIGFSKNWPCFFLTFGFLLWKLILITYWGISAVYWLTFLLGFFVCLLIQLCLFWGKVAFS